MQSYSELRLEVSLEKKKTSLGLKVFDFDLRINLSTIN